MRDIEIKGNGFGIKGARGRRENLVSTLWWGGSSS